MTKTHSLNKELLRLAGPNILSNISVPLLSAVDTALMGDLSVEHLGAIGLATMIFNFFYWNFGFLRMGTTGLVAQAHGAQDVKKLSRLISQSAMIALLIAVVILLFQFAIVDFSIFALDIAAAQIPLVKEYFYVRIWSAPATLLLYTCFGWFFGRQNVIAPLIITIVINLSNIVLSIFFVKHLGWGISGVAIGTLLAEYLGLLIAVVLLFGKNKIGWTIKFYSQGWTEILSVNKDLFIRTLALTTAFGIFYRFSSSSGTLVLAANVVLLQFLSWMSYAVDGFAFASESMVGKYLGAKRETELLRTIKLTFIWSFGIACFFAGLFFFGNQFIAAFFTNDGQVLEVIHKYTFWLLALPLFAFVCYVWDGVYIGLTATTEMRNSMLLSLAIFFILVITLRGFISNSIWVSFVIFLAVRGIILSYYFFKKQLTIIKNMR